MSGKGQKREGLMKGIHCIKKTAFEDLEEGFEDAVLEYGELAGVLFLKGATKVVKMMLLEEFSLKDIDMAIHRKTAQELARSEAKQEVLLEEVRRSNGA